MRNWKKYFLPLGIFGVAVCVFIIRYWALTAGGRRPVFSGEQQQDNVTSGVFAEQDLRYGIPKIDPANDPLAPVAGKRKSKILPRQESPSSTKKFYELPQDTPIFLQ